MSIYINVSSINERERFEECILFIKHNNNKGTYSYLTICERIRQRNLKEEKETHLTNRYY